MGSNEKCRWLVSFYSARGALLDAIEVVSEGEPTLWAKNRLAVGCYGETFTVVFIGYVS